MALSLIFVVVILAMLLIAWATGIRIINEYERGVVLRLGRLIRLKGPGLRVIIPFGIDRLIRVDLRTVTLEVPPQEAITRDNVSVNVLAVIYFQVVHPQSAVIKVQNYYNATTQISQSTLRSVLGQCTLHELLAERAKLNALLQRVIDEQTEPWGVKVTAVEIKDVEMPDSLQRAMARQAEAEREKQAKIIDAEGELAAAEKLTEAARVMAQSPGSMQLRYMQTLNEIGEEQNTVIVFPLPMELIEPLLSLRGSAQPATGGQPTGGRDGTPRREPALTARLVPSIPRTPAPEAPATGADASDDTADA
jgi:regulator of protease activity HflC (stomatin/prohibitin superfamily)